MTMIELGDVTRDRPPRAAEDRIRPRLDRFRLRQIALALAAIGVLACGAAAPADEPGVRRLWSGDYGPESMFAVAGTTLYVLNTGELTAYDLAGGSVRWTWRTAENLMGFRPTQDGGPVLVAVGSSDPGEEPEPYRTTVALRPDTGAEIWQRPGVVRLDTAESVLLVGHSTDGTDRLTRVRLTDGEPIWTHPAPGLQEVAFDRDAGPVGRLAFSTSSGDVTVLRYSDAAQVASRRFEGIAPDEAGIVYVSLSVDGGRLLLFHNEIALAYTTVHDMATLREVFRSAADDNPVSGCQAVLCRFTGDVFTAVDPATGRDLWQESPVIGLSMVSDDRLLLDLGDSRERVLVDSRTGRELASRLSGIAVFDPVRQGSVLLLRPSISPLGRTTVARVNLTTGAQNVLGALTVVPDPQSCQTVPGYLICPGADRFVVTAVPSTPAVPS
ncbi:hypothetical protein [Actinoplanes sp. GCM10030250]|uniref:hypothetical protein n=1 Tax=Actinoplanes sp. GCM10030250 TaxID=3273376 RepID=UPI003619AD6F